MKPLAKCYVALVILCGMLLAPFGIYRYFSALTEIGLRESLMDMLCLTVLFCVCRSAPIYITTHHSLDVSVLAVIAAVLLRGPYAAVTVAVVGSLFTVEFDSKNHEPQHIFNTPPQKSLFNLSNLVLSILLPGLLLGRFGYVTGNVVMPQVIWPMFAFTVLTFLLNSLILLTLFTLNGDMSASEALNMTRGLIPNVLSAMPLGLLTALLFDQDNGCWIALLMLLPLMLARHAWKLYLESQTQYYRLIHAFVASVEAKDKYTEGHSRRVNRYAEWIAHEMRLKSQTIETIKTAALLHDIGKIGIEDAILHKPTRLTEEEYKRIQMHPKIGVDIVGQVGLSDEILEIILHHHERYDGAGYPERLPSEKLSLGAQILAVADAYDAMTSERPYRKGMPREEAVNRLIADKGRQFNPEIVDCFLHALNSHPACEAEPA